MNIKKHLKFCSGENILRLAKYLRLNIKGMSLRQIKKLIKWRLSRNINNRY